MDTEADALRRLSTGDPLALAQLYDALAPSLLAFALRLTGRREDAEEVVQDVFVRLCRDSGRFDPRLGSVRAWAYTMARNLATSRGRALAARPLVADIDPDGPVGGLDPTDHRDATVMVREAMAHLAPLDRLLVEGAYLDGWSHSELADRHALPLGTVKSRLRRALARLRTRWTDA